MVNNGIGGTREERRGEERRGGKGERRGGEGGGEERIGERQYVPVKTKSESGSRTE